MLLEGNEFFKPAAHLSSHAAFLPLRSRPRTFFFHNDIPCLFFSHARTGCYVCHSDNQFPSRFFFFTPPFKVRFSPPLPLFNGLGIPPLVVPQLHSPFLCKNLFSLRLARQRETSAMRCHEFSSGSKGRFSRPTPPVPFFFFFSLLNYFSFFSKNCSRALHFYLFYLTNVFFVESSSPLPRRLFRIELSGYSPFLTRCARTDFKPFLPTPETLVSKKVPYCK